MVPPPKVSAVAGDDVVTAADGPANGLVVDDGGAVAMLKATLLVAIPADAKSSDHPILLEHLVFMSYFFLVPIKMMYLKVLLML